ncbi:MAG: TetR/AcrR family transcriptional regulator, partial [Ectothiorhodospiraceae bacterium]|nr:TetR/AcrR family transcriptional regulator [Ectothiorhodospiraceae bacterium]
MGKQEDTKIRILDTCRAILAEAGLPALTIDAVAARLGITKQAVIYWFPTKQELVRALVVPWLKAEADVVVEAAESAADGRQALAQAVRALVEFHTADLDRFRQMYLSIQVDPRPHKLLSEQTLRDDVHPATARMYGALEQALLRDSAFRGGFDARQVAFTVHSSALGLISMVALGKAVG